MLERFRKAHAASELLQIKRLLLIADWPGQRGSRQDGTGLKEAL
jgi:hypothetical protein